MEMYVKQKVTVKSCNPNLYTKKRKEKKKM